MLALLRFYIELKVNTSFSKTFHHKAVSKGEVISGSSDLGVQQLKGKIAAAENLKNLLVACHLRFSSHDLFISASLYLSIM